MHRPQIVVDNTKVDPPVRKLARCVAFGKSISDRVGEGRRAVAVLYRGWAGRPCRYTPRLTLKVGANYGNQVMRITELT